MKVKLVSYFKCLEHEKLAFQDGYRFVCQCGESHRTKPGAMTCRKCRRYLADLPTHISEIILI